MMTTLESKGNLRNIHVEVDGWLSRRVYNRRAIRERVRSRKITRITKFLSLWTFCVICQSLKEADNRFSTRNFRVNDPRAVTSNKFTSPEVVYPSRI